MDLDRQIGLKHCYLDINQDKFSNVALGIILRGLGIKLKILYINNNKNIELISNYFNKHKLTKFITFLSTQDFNTIIDSNIKNNSKQINENKINNFENVINFKEFNIIIFDNLNFKEIENNKIKLILNLKNKNTEFITILNNKNNFDEINQEFDLISEYNYTCNKENNLVNNSINIFGNGKGKTTYLIGNLFNKLIQNKNDIQDLELIYFDKGGNFYSERKLFDKLRLNYKVTGTLRFKGGKFRFENVNKDYNEAKKGLNFINKSNKKIIACDELNTTIASKLLKEEQIIEILSKKVKTSDLIISGRLNSNKIKQLFSTLIEVKELKHYSRNGFGIKKGIDY